MANRSRGGGAFHIRNPALAEHTQYGMQTAANAQIHKSKKQRSQCGHDKYHYRSQQNFPPGRSYNFGYLSANLLDKLDRISSGHLAFVPLMNARDIAGQNGKFKTVFRPCEFTRANRCLNSRHNPIQFGPNIPAGGIQNSQPETNLIGC